MSHVTCQVSGIRHVLLFFFLYIFNIFKKLDKAVELVGGGCVINDATPSSIRTVWVYMFLNTKNEKKEQSYKNN